MNGGPRSDPSLGAPRRIRWLVRCYPPAWRARYGEEFTQLLLDDGLDRPGSVGRSLDVVRSGLLARLTYAGLTGDALAPGQQVRAGLGMVARSSAAFLAAGIAIWAQLTIGWQWSAPAAAATRTGMLLISATMLVFALIGLFAAAPIVWEVARAVARGRGRRLMGPLAGIGVGGLVLVVGAIHVGHGWPGTGGHPWSGRDLVPGSVARFCWAATLSITSYWAHPTALASFPASEIVWMLVSPAAVAVVVAGVTRTLRRLPLSSGVLRYEAHLGLAVAAAMIVCLAGAGSWVISGGPAPRGLFRAGAIDMVALAIMAASLIVAFRAGRRAVGFSRGAPAGRSRG